MPVYFVSFNPDIRMEENLPAFASLEEPEVRRLVSGAVGVVLPSYLMPWRYRNIVRWARNWFPRLDARFGLCGKTKQIVLFRKMGARHPESRLFQSAPELASFLVKNGAPWDYPFVLKGDTGGGGSSVFPIYARGDIVRYLPKLPPDKPLLLQQWVHHGGKDLRVVIYGDHTVSYFRVGDGQFYNNVCQGGRIDYDSWPGQLDKGVQAVKAFSERAGIDIAGYDLMFPDEGEPVFIEINFHFGRKGLGGRDGHRKHMQRAVRDWRNKCLSSVHSTCEGPELEHIQMERT